MYLVDRPHTATMERENINAFDLGVLFFCKKTGQSAVDLNFRPYSDSVSAGGDGCMQLIAIPCAPRSCSLKFGPPTNSVQYFLTAADSFAPPTCLS